MARGLRQGRLGRKGLWKGLAWLSGFLSSFVVGMVYLYPLYSQWFQTALGVDDVKLNLIGNLQLAALGLAVLPLALFHTAKSRTSPRQADFFTSLISGLLVTCGCFLAGGVTKTNLRGPALVTLVSIGFMASGAATSSVLSHSIWVSAANYADNPTAKRIATASIPLAVGFGGFVPTLIAGYVPLDPWDWIMVHGSLGLFTLLLRLAFHYRVEPATDRDEREEGKAMEGREEGWEMDERDEDRHRDALGREGIAASSNSKAGREAADGGEGQSSVLKNLGQTLAAFWTSAIPWLEFVSVSISNGLGGVLNATTGDVLLTAGAGEREVAVVSTVFLGAQAASRLAVTLLQPLGDFSEWLFVVGCAIQLAAFALPWALGASPGIMISTGALAGTSFGITWGTWPNCVQEHFPGGLQKAQLNFGIFLWSCFGAIFIALAGNGILLNAQGEGCRKDQAGNFRGQRCYENVWALYTLLAAVALITSVAIAILILRGKKESGSITREPDRSLKAVNATDQSHKD